MKTLARIFQELRASVELCAAVPGRAAAVRGRTQGSLINDTRFFRPCQSFLVIAHWTSGFLGTWLCYHFLTHADMLKYFLLVGHMIVLAKDLLIDGHLWTLPQWRVSRGRELRVGGQRPRLQPRARPHQHPQAAARQAAAARGQAPAPPGHRGRARTRGGAGRGGGGAESGAGGCGAGAAICRVIRGTNVMLYVSGG